MNILRFKSILEICQFVVTGYAGDCTYSDINLFPCKPGLSSVNHELKIMNNHGRYPISATDSNKMTPKPRDQPTERCALANKQVIPVLLTDMVIFDNGYASMKERFKREMSRIDEQMNKFSIDLMNVYGETSTVQKNVVNSTSQLNNETFTDEAPTAVWEVLKSSPLVVGQENDKFLKLQFDVSQFDPSEVSVRLLDDLLIVTASHEEKSKDSTVYREYNRQFNLPPGANPELIVATLSLDGVLTVETPLPQSIPRSDETNSVFSDAPE